MKAHTHSLICYSLGRTIVNSLVHTLTDIVCVCIHIHICMYNYFTKIEAYIIHAILQLALCT